MRLDEVDQVTHLGVILAKDAQSHAAARIKATRRALYALQGAGLCTIIHIFNTAVRPVLVYGLECVHQK